MEETCTITQKLKASGTDPQRRRAKQARQHTCFGVQDLNMHLNIDVESWLSPSPVMQQHQVQFRLPAGTICDLLP